MSKIIFTSQTYTTKANAMRGAKRAGHIENVMIETRDEGFGYIVIAHETTKTPSYKMMYSREHSRVESPFKIVHAFLDANPTMKRKNAIAALVAQGVNFSTARTQYQRWFSKRNAA